ncbi:hypothetical protein LCGC14_1074100 [marine sediment metagenome]|uniref:Peptide deformylase n=1 Tax=marine sediment metagenome TaxID=412755 RepID=A0A0F9MLZ1_9ZZZZ
MTVLNIRQFGDPVLKQESQKIVKIDKSLKNLAKNMADTMYDASGLGLAAVQIGVLQQLIVTDVSGEGEDLRALINPEIIDMDGEITEEEGCLSVGTIRLPIKRAQTIKVKAIDLKTGEEVVFEAQDWIARAMQHEIDHIQGRLILDRASKDDKAQAIKELMLGTVGEK